MGSFLPEIKEFTSNFNKLFPQLEDDKRVYDLTFLWEITGKLNELNFQHQGRNKTLTEMVNNVNAFKFQETFIPGSTNEERIKTFRK